MYIVHISKAKKKLQKSVKKQKDNVNFFSVIIHRWEKGKKICRLPLNIMKIR